MSYAYMVMEFLQGQDLREYLKNSGRNLTPEETIVLLMPIMKALKEVHEIGLIHRDISPDNTMLTTRGTVKLLYFGIAKDLEGPGSQSTTMALKHGFAPMEQYLSNGDIGPWTDEYALCATAYYCMTGKIPPEAPSRVMNEDKGSDMHWEQIPGMRPQWSEALAIGFSPKAKDRFASVGALKNALESTPQVTVQVNQLKEKTPKWKFWVGFLVTMLLFDPFVLRGVAHSINAAYALFFYGEWCTFQLGLIYLLFYPRADASSAAVGPQKRFPKVWILIPLTVVIFMLLWILETVLGFMLNPVFSPVAPVFRALGIMGTMYILSHGRPGNTSGKKWLWILLGLDILLFILVILQFYTFNFFLILGLYILQGVKACRFNHQWINTQQLPPEVASSQHKKGIWTIGGSLSSLSFFSCLMASILCRFPKSACFSDPS